MDGANDDVIVNERDAFWLSTLNDATTWCLRTKDDESNGYASYGYESLL